MCRGATPDEGDMDMVMVWFEQGISPTAPLTLLEDFWPLLFWDFWRFTSTLYIHSQICIYEEIHLRKKIQTHNRVRD
jgi:hypothetical protein